MNSSSISNDFDEKILFQHDDQNILFSFMHIVFNLKFKKSKNSRIDYAKLRKISRINKSFVENDINIDINYNDDFIHIILKKFDIFKCQIRRHLFLLQLIKKIIFVIIEKLLSFAKKKKIDVNENALSD